MLRTYLSFHSFTLITWAVIMALFAVLVGALYQTFADQPTLAEAYEGLPDAIKAAAGYEPGAFEDGVLSSEAFISTELYAWWPLVLAIYAIIYGAGALAGEAERKTLDLVLVQPVHRARFVLSKFVVLLVGLAVIGLFTIIGVELGLLATGASISLQGLVAVQIQAWAVVAAIGAYAFAFSALTLSYRAALAWAGGLTVLQYAWDLTAATVDALEPLAPLTLMYYYSSFDLLTTGELSYTGLAVAAGVLAVGLGVALAAFQRKDIAA